MHYNPLVITYTITRQLMMKKTIDSQVIMTRAKPEVKDRLGIHPIFSSSLHTTPHV